MDEAKNKVEEATGLRPTNEKLLNGYRTLKIPPRIKDHMRNMLIGKVKCGEFWRKMPGLEVRATCAACKKKDNSEIMESEQHMWLECENNRQALTWETAKEVWQKSTERDWPNLSIGLIRGTAALKFEIDLNKDSDRIRILISIGIWAIWKSRDKTAITDQDVSPNETSETLKELIKAQVRKSWNATRFLKGKRKLAQQRTIQTLWADGKLTDFRPKSGPVADFS